MPRPEEPEKLTVRETLSQLTVGDLKALLALIRGSVQARKPELVDQLAGVLEKPEEVRALYDGLDDLAKKAVQEATYDPQGVWHRSRFEAKHGGLPTLDRKFAGREVFLRLLPDVAEAAGERKGWEVWKKL